MGQVLVTVLSFFWGPPTPPLLDFHGTRCCVCGGISSSSEESPREAPVVAKVKHKAHKNEDERDREERAQGKDLHLE
jgi:hypothetical protein